MTKLQLIAIATEMNIAVTAKMTKAVIVELIEAGSLLDAAQINDLVKTPTFGELADKLASTKPVIEEETVVEDLVEQFFVPEIKIEEVVIVEEIKVVTPVVYAEGTYVVNVRNNHLFKVGVVCANTLYVGVSKYISKGHLEAMTFSVKSLMNTKIHVVLTKEEVKAKINAAVKPSAKYEVNATVKNGYVDLTVKDLDTKEIHAAKPGSTMYPMIKTYLSSFKGNATTVTVETVARPSKKVEVKQPAKEVKIDVCSCCGKEVSSKVSSFCNRAKKAIKCYPCQVKAGDVAKTKATTAAKKLAV